MEVIRDKNSRKVFGCKVEYGDKSYLVDYEVRRGMVAVHYAGCEKTAQIGGLPEYNVVRLLFVEMLQEEVAVRKIKVTKPWTINCRC